MLDLRFCAVKLASMALTPEQLADIRTRIPARPETGIPERVFSAAHYENGVFQGTCL